ncbi:MULTISPECIES: DUF1707 and DUF4190 domain-containing protein [unclassified Streptomyces]|uniref:DUF1707 and DUF4190 domain-containing protein n=1 Tax=unclassified Streptomyces TaxID=2593676 RepID=UPI0034011B6C
MAQQPWGQQYPVHPPASPYGVSSVQPGQAWQPAQLPASAMRASHTDRDRTVDVLKAAYAEGRLSREEYGQRFDAASQAQTYGQLAQLVADLPAGPMAVPYGAAAPVAPAFAGHPVPMPVAMPMTMPVPLPARRVNGMAIASLVLGVLCLPTLGMAAPGAVITGHIAKAQIRARGEEGEAPATLGLVLGWLAMGGWALLFVLAGFGALG